ncbi:MAG: hypothetical protein AAF370_08175 [Pseudomonadota bacterium]
MTRSAESPNRLQSIPVQTSLDTTHEGREGDEAGSEPKRVDRNLS